MRSSATVVIFLSSAALFGCKARIGDSCHTSVDCSVTGNRVCDVAAPGGYCTIRGCDPDSCPNHALCVEWRYSDDRTAEPWCMRQCGSNSDCHVNYHQRRDSRTDYHCVHVETDPDNGDLLLVDTNGNVVERNVARVTDLKPGRAEHGFCVYIAPSTPDVDASMSDGSVGDGG